MGRVLVCFFSMIDCLVLGLGGLVGMSGVYGVDDKLPTCTNGLAVRYRRCRVTYDRRSRHRIPIEGPTPTYFCSVSKKHFVGSSWQS